MATQYIGARYVPVFADPTEWTNTRTYEPLTIVMHQGNSYTSKQAVPVGIDISNESFWVRTGDYNAQIEQYRNEVTHLATTVDALEGSVTTLETGLATEVSNRTAADTQLAADISTETSARESAVSAEASARADADTALGNSIDSVNSTLGGRISELSTSVNAQISALSAEVEGLVANVNPLDFTGYEGYNLVTFGDSFMDPNVANSSYGYLPNRLGEALGSSVFNFAVAGAGWARTDNTIAMQLATSISSMTASQRTNTRLVIAYAGFNDWNNAVTTSDVSAAIMTFITSARATFPNARILVIPFNFQFSKLTPEARTYIHTVMRAIRTFDSSGVTIITEAWLWLLGIPEFFRNQAHPSDAGYDQICAQILNSMDGGGRIDCGVSERFDIGANVAGFGANSILYAECDQNYVHVNGNVRKASAGTGTINIFDDYERPLYAPGNFIVIPLTYTSLSSTSTGYIQIQTSGKFNVHFPNDYAANGVCWFEATYPVGLGGIEYTNVTT